MTTQASTSSHLHSLVGIQNKDSMSDIVEKKSNNDSLGE